MTNVLSIDWDYFIQASTQERARLFPDGGNENLSETLREVIWSGLYASNDELKQIRILHQQLEDLNEILEKGLRKKTKVIIVDSHRHIYSYIKSIHKGGMPLHLVNIDFHHDRYKINKKEMHAGNWLKIIMDEYPEGDYTWIAKKDSDMDEEESSLKVLYETFEGLKGVKWDLLFICRSDMWSPPHLDDDFIDNFSWLVAEHKVVGDLKVFEDRYSKYMDNNRNLWGEAK